MAILAVVAASPPDRWRRPPCGRSASCAPSSTAVEAVPVFRPQDAAENEGRGARANLETFAECIRRLQAGRSVVLFPEGMSRPSPKLLPLRTGAARIALDAEVAVTVVPIGLLHEPPADATRARCSCASASRSSSTAATARTRDGVGSRPPRAGWRPRSARCSPRPTASRTSSCCALAAAVALAGAGHRRPVARGAPRSSCSGSPRGSRRCARSIPPSGSRMRAEGAAFAAPSRAARPARRSARRALRRLRGSPGSSRGTLAPPRDRRAARASSRPSSRHPRAWPATSSRCAAGYATEDVLPFARIFGRTFFLAIETLLVAALLAIFVSPTSGLATLITLPALFAVHVVLAGLARRRRGAGEGVPAARGRPAPTATPLRAARARGAHRAGRTHSRAALADGPVIRSWPATRRMAVPRSDR